jgi:hypothetical protein
VAEDAPLLDAVELELETQPDVRALAAAIGRSRSCRTILLLS